MHAIPCILSTLDYCNSLPSASSADVRDRESDDVTDIRAHTYTDIRIKQRLNDCIVLWMKRTAQTVGYERLCVYALYKSTIDINKIIDHRYGGKAPAP